MWLAECESCPTCMQPSLRNLHATYAHKQDMLSSWHVTITHTASPFQVSALHKIKSTRQNLQRITQKGASLNWTNSLSNLNQFLLTQLAELIAQLVKSCLCMLTEVEQIITAEHRDLKVLHGDPDIPKIPPHILPHISCQRVCPRYFALIAELAS